MEPRTYENPATGEWRTSSAWAEALGISKCAFLWRVRNLKDPAAIYRAGNLNERKVTDPKTGETHSMAEWSRILGFARNRMSRRKSNGWGGDAIFRRTSVNACTVTHDGREYTVAELVGLCKWRGATKQGVYKRIRDGWSFEEITTVPRKCHKTSRVYEDGGETKTIHTFARDRGACPVTLKYRARKGWCKSTHRMEDLLAALPIRTAEDDFARKGTTVLTHGGETHTLAFWAKLMGIKPDTLRNRIGRYGWDVGKALTLRPYLRDPNTGLPMKDMKYPNGLTESQILTRLRWGWSFADATTVPLLTRREAAERGTDASMKGTRRRELAALGIVI